MSEDSNKEISLRYLPFRGKKDEWNMWSQKFLAKARKKGYKDILIGKTKIPKTSDDDYDVDEAKRLEELNKEAYYDLSTAMEDKVAFNKVVLAKTDDLPDGDAYLAWKMLNNKKNPNNAADPMEKYSVPTIILSSGMRVSSREYSVDTTAANCVVDP